MADPSVPLDLKSFEGHTPGPWELWTGCSWRRIGKAGTLQEVVTPTKLSDGCPDLVFPNGGERGPDARLLVAAPDLLAEVTRLRSRLQQMEEAVEAFVKQWDVVLPHINGAFAMTYMRAATQYSGPQIGDEIGRLKELVNKRGGSPTDQDAPKE